LGERVVDAIDAKGVERAIVLDGAIGVGGKSLEHRLGGTAAANALGAETSPLGSEGATELIAPLLIADRPRLSDLLSLKLRLPVGGGLLRAGLLARLYELECGRCRQRSSGSLIRPQSGT